MIYIVDGPDGSGKTTLARELVEKIGGRYIHLTYRFKERIFDYHTAAIRLAARSKVPIVIDRWWPTEAIYAKAYRGGSTWPMQGRLADRIARKFGAIYIYCLPSSVNSGVAMFNKLKEEREEMYEDIQDVIDLYIKLWDGHLEHEDKGQYIDFLIRNGGLKDRPDHRYYNIGHWGHAKDLFCERVIEQSYVWRGLQYEPALDFNEWNVTGHLCGSSYLFVGDQANPKFRELSWPFYEYGNSSLYLTELLHRLNFKEDAAMWCNAYNVDGSMNRHIQGIVSRNPKIKVITLGERAQEVCDKNSIQTHANVWHPSYAKRFNKKEEYEDQITEALKHELC